MIAKFFPWYSEITRPQKNALFSAWLGYVFDGFDFMLIFYIMYLIKADLGLTDMEGAFLATAAFIGRPFGGALFGLLADKFGRKPLMMWSIVAYSVGTVLSGLASGVIMLTLSRFIVGMGMAGEYACASTYAVESWPKHLKSKASAFLVSGFGIGNIIAAYFMPSFAEAYGWRAAFFVGLLPVLLVIYIRARAPESKEWEEVKLSGPGKHSQSAWSVFSLSMKGLFNRAQFPLTLCVFIVLFSIFGANWPIFGLLPTYLAGEGFDTGVVSNLMTAAAFGTVLGNIVWGLCADRIGLKKTFSIGLLMSFLFIFPLFRIPQDNYLLLGACLFGLMATNVGVGGLVPKFLYDYFPLEVRGLGTGLIYNLAATSGTFNSMAATWLGITMGLGAALTFIVAFWTATILLIIGLSIPDRLKARRESFQSTKEF
ncbi:MFS transporter [Salmonella enterica]|nr:MFS transporter [Salmonella enterica]